MDRHPLPHLRSGPSQEFLQPPRPPSQPQQLCLCLLVVPALFSSARETMSSTEQALMSKC